MSDEAIDRPRLEAWFGAHVPGARPPLSFERISGGRSNLTYVAADAAGRRWALRRPPLGKRLASAHDMAREHRIISALRATDVPVPPVVGLCEDESINGAPFYVMEFVDGPILRSRPEAEESFDEGERGAIGERVVDTLVAIHARRPGRSRPRRPGTQAGLRRPPASSLARAVGEVEDDASSRPIDDVHRRLCERIPEQGPATIVHGDYRLDNMILSPSGEVAAVVDWELCTLGDPLADVGLLLVYWSEPGDELMPLFDAPTTAVGLSVARRRSGSATRASLGPRPLRDRLLRRARLLEAGDHPPGRLRPLRGWPVRRGRRGRRASSRRSSSQLADAADEAERRLG